MKNDILQDQLNQSLSRFKENIAIEYSGGALTYSELDRKTNYIANWLIRKGIKRETFIGVLIGDRMDFILSMMGILKAGGVFIPLDPALPGDRLELMMETTGTKYILIDKAHADLSSFNHAVKTRDRELIPVDELFSHLPGEGLPGKASWFGNQPDVRCSPEDKIYIYFTSGTTGRPRAILGRNKSLLHFINWEIETICKNEGFRTSQLTTPGFDAFLRDVLVPLCSGGVVCIPGDIGTIPDPDRLIAWIDKSGIQLIHCVPSVFRMLSSNNLKKQNFKALKYILLSGEKINPPDLVRWFELFNGRIQPVNLWGTSETTLAKTAYFIQKSDTHRERIPVGKPIKGARVVVLNKNLEICKPGIVGDLYIRTPYRTFGYYNDPGLNKERFIPNPFNDNPNDLLHKTGDLGRVLPDGNLDVLGRNDRQVKIRGIRIEPEEIESVLIKHSWVKEAVVIKKEVSSANELLCAYITGTGEKEVEAEQLTGHLQGYLSGKLPGYMVPSHIKEIERIPRTPNGKVDYARLPDPLAEDAHDYIAPTDEVEIKLAETWKEILGIEKIGITGHFFKLGGNSLNAVALALKIHKEFNIEFPLLEVFAKPTIEKQAAFIKDAEEEKHVSIEVVEKKEYYALSSAQKRMYILQQMEPGSISYNLQVTLVLKGYMDKERMEETFRKLIQRHENFRTSFEMVDAVPVQRIHKQIPFGIVYFDSNEEYPHGIVNRFIKPFDPGQAPLLRVGLIKIGDAAHILMVDLHHIITDGISIEILKKDFGTLSAGEDLPPLRLHYKDYSQWQNSEKQKKVIQQQKEYWLKKFAGEVPLLNLPADYPRPDVQDFAGDRVYFKTGEEKNLQLKALALEEGVTLYMVCLAIFNILLYKITGQEDIIVGTDTAGRGHADLQNVIGMFVNTLALRNYPAPARTFAAFLEEIKKRTLEAFGNQDYQFDSLVEQVVVNRDLSRNPLFDVSFDYFNLNMNRGDRPKPARPRLSQIPYNREKKISKFDLTLKVSEPENEDSLIFVFEYCTKLFKKEKIETFVIFFKEILSAVLDNPRVTLGAIEISLQLLAKKKEEVQPDDLDF